MVSFYSILMPSCYFRRNYIAKKIHFHQAQIFYFLSFLFSCTLSDSGHIGVCSDLTFYDANFKAYLRQHFLQSVQYLCQQNGRPFIVYLPPVRGFLGQILDVYAGTGNFSKPYRYYHRKRICSAAGDLLRFQ